MINLGETPFYTSVWKMGKGAHPMSKAKDTTACAQILRDETLAVFADWKQCTNILSPQKLGQALVQ